MINEALRKWLIVIPARLASTRLPQKATLDLCGKPMIIRVYENLDPLNRKGVSIIVATDSPKVVALCNLYAIPSFLTKQNHISGTDRCYEVACSFNYEYILNVQGDEPFIDCDDLLSLIENTNRLDRGCILTLAYRSRSKKDFRDPSVVKVLSKKKEAISFFRTGMPQKECPFFYHHLGVYAYRKETLESFCSLKRSPLELELKLEQMRAVENGLKIMLLDAKRKSFGIDTKEDLVKARKIYSLRKSIVECQN